MDNVSLIISETEALNKFHNCKRLNGADVWRKIVTPIINNSQVQKMMLREQVHNPAGMKSLADFDRCMEDWSTSIREYIECGGVEPSEEDKRCMLMRIGLDGNVLARVRPAGA